MRLIGKCFTAALAFVMGSLVGILIASGPAGLWYSTQVQDQVLQTHEEELFQIYGRLGSEAMEQDGLKLRQEAIVQAVLNLHKRLQAVEYRSDPTPAPEY